MASAEDAIFSRLSAVSAVTSLLGSPPRVYPIKHRDGANPSFPFVTYELILAERIRAMTADTGDVEATFRFHIWTKDAATGGFIQGRNIADALRTALQRWSGTAGGVEVKHVFDDGEYDIPDPEPKVYHRVLDFDVRWAE